MSDNINYKRRAILSHYGFSLLALLAALTLLWLNSSFNWQSDWTSGTRNTLNQSSIELLHKMQGPINVQAYFDSHSQVRQQVNQFIDRYQRFKKDITLSFVDSQLPTDQLLEMGFTQLGQLKISYQNKSAFINRLKETNMTKALFQLARKQDTWVAVIQGHGERDPLDTGNNGLSKLVDELSKTGIKVQPLNLIENQFIPDNTKVLMIAGPREAYLDGEITLIENYIAQGGNLLWLRDPAKLNYLQSLDALLDINLIPGVMIDANTRLRILLGIQHAAVIPITQFEKHKITEGLNTHLLFPFASALQSVAQSEWDQQVLFNSLQRSWSELGEINTDKLKYQPELGEQQGPLAMGLALTRNINGHNQRVVVIGDSDFIANGYIGHGNNFTLSANILNWLSEDDSLLAITAQAAPDQKLELHDKDIMFIAGILLLAIPLLLIGTGLGIRWSRHRK